MKQRVLLFLGIVVVTSGCIGLMNGNGDEASGPITVEELSVQPTHISAGSDVRVDKTIANTGNMDTNVTVGEEGQRILQDYCTDIFEIENYEITSTTHDGDDDVQPLDTGDRLSMSWDLNQDDPNRIPLQGSTCNMQFQAPFEYDLDAYRQIQVKSDPGEPSLTDLEVDETVGPLSIDISLLGTSSEDGVPIFIDGDRIEARISVHNTEPEDGEYSGVISIDTPDLSSTDGLSLDCDDDEIEEIVLHDGQSQIIECDVDVEEEDFRSIREEIRVSSNYQYVANTGSTSVEVEGEQ